MYPLVMRLGRDRWSTLTGPRDTWSLPLMRSFSLGGFLEFILLLLLLFLVPRKWDRQREKQQQQRSICQSVVVGAIGTRRCIFNRLLLLFLVASLFVHFCLRDRNNQKGSQRKNKESSLHAKNMIKKEFHNLKLRFYFFISANIFSLLLHNLHLNNEIYFTRKRLSENRKL